MGTAMLLAVVFVYMVLASQFGSFIQPLIIMLALPLAAIGGLLALLVFKLPLDMTAMIGLILLFGLVTKNSILLVDLTNKMRRQQGMDIAAALRTAGPIRLRPILMTTLALILGMLPVAIGLGTGSAFRRPMAITVIGGLITSTILTLLLVPTAYSLVEGALARYQRSRQAQAARQSRGRGRQAAGQGVSRGVNTVTSAQAGGQPERALASCTSVLVNLVPYCKVRVMRQSRHYRNRLAGELGIRGKGLSVFHWRRIMSTALFSGGSSFSMTAQTMSRSIWSCHGPIRGAYR